MNKHLDEIAITLQKACHAPDCTDPFICPEIHKNCAKRLDQTTAIAWQVAREINKFICFNSTEYKHIYITNVSMASKLLNYSTLRDPRLAECVQAVAIILNYPNDYYLDIAKGQAQEYMNYRHRLVPAHELP